MQRGERIGEDKHEKHRSGGRTSAQSGRGGRTSSSSTGSKFKNHSSRGFSIRFKSSYIDIDT